MKKRIYPLTSLVVVMMLAVTLTACGGEKSAGTSTTGKTASSADNMDETSSVVSVSESQKSTKTESAKAESKTESAPKTTQAPTEKPKAPTETPKATPSAAETPKATPSATATPKQVTPTPAVEKETAVESSTEIIPESIITEVIEEESVEEDWSIPYNYVDDFSIEYQTDFLHISTDPVTLGNNEKVTIRLTANPSGLKEDDFIFYCEEDELSYSVEEIKQNTSQNETEIRLTVRAKKEGYHYFDILSLYDLITLGEEAPGIELQIHALDSRDGQVVYVTPTGEKYHFSADCAGENAITTTLYDAEADEYDPCGKCAR